MSLSTAVFVGESRKWIPDFIEKSKRLKVNAGMCMLVLFGNKLSKHMSATKHLLQPTFQDGFLVPILVP